MVPGVVLVFEDKSGTNNMGGESGAPEGKLFSRSFQYIWSYIEPFLHHIPRSSATLERDRRKETKSCQTSVREMSHPRDIQRIESIGAVSRKDRYREARTMSGSDTLSDFRKACAIVQQFSLSDSELVDVRDLMRESMERGLERDNAVGKQTICLGRAFYVHL